MGAIPEGVPVAVTVTLAIGDLAATGLRVLAFARTEMPVDTQRISGHSLPHQFTFLGLQGMIDPPRPEAGAAVAACHLAGIQVKMIRVIMQGRRWRSGGNWGWRRKPQRRPTPWR